jgi:Family of unknown function (DUF6077)
MNPPIFSRFVRTAVLFFGLWTASSQFVVALGGNLYVLFAVFGASSVGGVWVSRRYRIPGVGPPAAEPELPAHLRIPNWGFAVAVASSAILLIVLGGIGTTFTSLWAVAALLFAAGLGWTFVSGSPAINLSPERVPVFQGIVLWSLAVVCAALTLVSHRSSLDDAFYVNVAVHVAQEPGAALLARDTIFGFADMPLQLPIYKLHSIEVLGGAISYLTGMRAILAMHWVIATFAALLVPLVQAELFRRVLPRHWLGATIIASMALFAWGGENIAFGNFAFVHLYQGKAIFTAVYVPLLLAYAYDFIRAPSWRSWVLLVAVQVGAVGMTWIALALGPFLVSVTLLAGLGRGRSRAFLWGISSCSYAIVTGLIVRTSVHGRPVQWEPVEDVDALMSQSLHAVGGGGFFLALVIGLSVIAWSAAVSAHTRRLFLLLPLLFLLSFFNPWLVPYVAEELGNHSVYARVFWGLPLPLLVALGFYAPWTWISRRHRSWIGELSTILLAVALLHLWMPQHTLSRSNGTVIGLPTAKVRGSHYEMARLLVQKVPDGKAVLAPSEVAAWVSTFEDHPDVLYSRHNYYPFLEWQVGEPEARRRRRLASAAAGMERLSIPDLRQAVERYDLGAVCMTIPNDQSKGVLSSLRTLGFEPVGHAQLYSVWVLNKPLPPPKSIRRPR